ncbi:Aerobactin synthase [compost metagenome]
MKTLYSKIEGLGEIRIRPFDPEKDTDFLHQWANQEYAYFWGLQKTTREEVYLEYQRLTEQQEYEIYVGEWNQNPLFLFESYNPDFDLIRDYYEVQSGDRGVHIIVAPVSVRVPNFTWYVFTIIAKFLFTDASTQRILVEPDIRNKKMFALCERIGFRLGKVVELPHKTAQLAYLERRHFQQIISTTIIQKRSSMNTIDNSLSPQTAAKHIQQHFSEKANIALIKKALTEFSHEQLIKPVLQTNSGILNEYIVQSDAPEITYQFTAKQMLLNHLQIRPDSIRKIEKGVEKSPDAVLFIKEFRKQLGLSDKQLPVYLEEIISTLHGSMYKLAKGNPPAEELAHASFQTIEQSMTEGHPCFVANNGRIGFDSGDYRAYAPEAGNSFSLLWLAGNVSRVKFSGSEELTYDQVIAQELSEHEISYFNEIIRSKGLDPKDYLFLPIHPWQWFNKLVHIYTPELAAGNLICLGYGEDQYLAQQSIRTLFNTSNPHKFYTKSALSILNMGFMRGLPHYYLGTAPVMALWLENLLYNDSFLAENGFRMLSEVASVSYVNPYFEEFGPHNDYNKMLASLWRESPVKDLNENEQLLTMAALVHVDQNDRGLLPELILASGLSVENWLSAYFDAYLIPLLHCFYQYDLVFMPHGENIILKLENHIPKHIFLKDITEEACILNKEAVLPEALNRMITDVPEDLKLLSVFIDVFDDFFRFMTPILDEQMGFPESVFWKTLADSIRSYQSRFPELKEKFEQYDLFADEFLLSCLNRLQINNNRQMIDLDDPVARLQFTGKLENPLSAFKQVFIPVEN